MFNKSGEFIPAITSVQIKTTGIITLDVFKIRRFSRDILIPSMNGSGGGEMKLARRRSCGRALLPNPRMANEVPYKSRVLQAVSSISCLDTYMNITHIILKTTSTLTRVKKHLQNKHKHHIIIYHVP